MANLSNTNFSKKKYKYPSNSNDMLRLVMRQAKQ